MTQTLYQNAPYMTECETQVTAIHQQGGIELQQTVFYPTGGGQPGDSGSLQLDAGTIEIVTTIRDKDSGQLLHIPKEGQPVPKVGESVIAKINWERRYRHMRMHSALHLLCAVVPCGVTGGQIGESKSRLDFDVGEITLDKEQLTSELNQIIAQDHPVSAHWISQDELDDNPALVKTLSVQPPRTSDQIRLMKIGDNLDLQPCGGTHVKNTSEIGRVRVSKIENKGKRNRRVVIVFDTD